MKNCAFVILYTFLSISFVNAQNWEATSIIQATKRDVNDNLGWSVAISDTYAIAGAYQDKDDANEHPSTNIGSVYVSKKNSDGTWLLYQKLTAPSGTPIENFGYSVALTDDVIVVGAPKGPYPYSSAGGAYVFEKNQLGNWIQVQELIPSDRSDFSQFGATVAVFGNIIVVSAPTKWSPEYLNAGAVYVFERTTAGNWIEKQTLVSSDARQEDQFGYSLAVDNDIIIVGSPYEDDDIVGDEIHGSYGAVYFFKKNETGTWDEKQKFTAPNRNAGALFGWSIDIDRNRAIIGASHDDYYGAAYFFELEADSWTFHQKIPSPNVNSFAHSVTIDGNNAIIGSGDHTGYRAFVYETDSTGNWKESVKLFSPSFLTYSYDKFGYSIAMSHGFAIIGGPGADIVDNQSNPMEVGAAYVFKASGKPLPFKKSGWLDISKASYNPILVDYDNDGDQDVFLKYFDSDLGINEGRIYKFNQGQYQVIAQKFPNVEYDGAVSWVDVNGDQWLDLIIKYTKNYQPVIEIFFNNHDDSFTSKDIDTNQLDNSWLGEFYFADYDNDADLDLLVQARTDNYDFPIIKLFNNDGHFNFSESGFSFNASLRSSQPWFDYNGDGFKDFMAVKKITCDRYALTIFRNNSAQNFEEQTSSLRALNLDFGNQTGDMVWADYDNDGDADILWTGTNGCSTGDGSSAVYKNNNGIFRSTDIAIPAPIRYVNMGIADLNNDGIPDLLSYGTPEQGYDATAFLLGTGNAFEKLTLYETPRPYQFGKTDIGDVDGDGDLDVLIAGSIEYGHSFIDIYQNNAAEGWSVKNDPPGVPSEFSAEYKSNSVTLKWKASSDDHTPVPALTYNVSLTRNDSVLVDSYSSFSGQRKRYIPGNTGNNLSQTFYNLKNGRYKAIVQAIDNGYAGSSFSTVVEFEIGSQNVNWAKATGGEEIQLVHDGASDKAGNLYFTGSMSSANGSNFISKYDVNKNLLWSKAFGYSDCHSIAIRTDNQGNVYASGYNWNAIQIDNIEIPSAKSGSAVFLLKLNKNGNVLWATSFNDGYSWLSGMDIDGQGNIYLAGEFLDSPNSTTTHQLLKYNSQGVLISKAGLDQSISLNDVRAGKDGLYAVGLEATTQSTLAGILVKLNYDFQLQWKAVPFEKDYSEASTLAIDSVGNVYVTGYQGMKYISKYSSEGKLIFSNLLEGSEYLFSSPVGAYNRRQWGLATQGTNLYFIGGLQGAFKIGPLSYNSADREVTIIKYNDIGYPQWIKKFRGEGDDYGRTLFQSGQELIVAGYFSGPLLDVNGCTLINHNAVYGRGSGFILSLKDDAENSCPVVDTSIHFPKKEFCESGFMSLNVNDEYLRYADWFNQDTKIEATSFESRNVNLPGEYYIMANPNSSCATTGPILSIETEQLATAETDIIILPVQVGEIHGKEIVCPEEEISYFIAPLDSYQYEWKAQKGDFHSSTGDTANIEWTTEGQDLLILTATNLKNGCQTNSQLRVKILALPGKPAITQTGNVLTASTAQKYQWYLNEEPIPMEAQGESQTLTITETGNYSVRITDVNSCTNLSDQITSVFTGFETSYKDSFKYYPIPANDYLNIETGLSDAVKVTIRDSKNKEISTHWISDKNSININHLESGLYLLYVESPNYSMAVKFIKL